MRKALLIYLHGKDEPGLSLALGYLKAYADADEEVRRTWSIEIHHARDDTDPREVVATIDRAAVEVVGFSCYSWNIQAVHRVVKGLDAKNRPRVVLGGVEVTPQPVDVLRRNRQVDFVVIGEGEETFRVLLQRLGKDGHEAGSEDLSDVEGLAWRNGRSVKVNGPRPPIADLSTIPSPYLSGSYGDYVRGIETVPVETARGCPYSCTFCFEPRGFKTMRAFPLDTVKKELAFIARLGVPEIEFFDTNLNYDRKRSVEILRFLRTLGKRLRYRFELRAELIDEEQCRALGALTFFAELGLQSTNPEALEAVKRPTNMKKFESGVRSLLDASIYRPCSYSPLSGVLIDVMVGLPRDTASDILASFDYTFGLAPSRIAVAITKILPGTELYDDVTQRKFRYKYDPEDDHIIRSTATLSRQEVQDFIHFKYAVDSAYNKLHAVRTIGWMARQLQVRPSEIFMEYARRLARDERVWEAFTVKDLTEVLTEIAEKRGHAEVGKKVGSKLAAETMLNLLQNVKEKRRSWWSRLLFGAGYRFLSVFGGLPPLPESVPPRPPAAAPEPAVARAER